MKQFMILEVKKIEIVKAHKTQKQVTKMQEKSIKDGNIERNSYLVMICNISTEIKIKEINYLILLLKVTIV